MAGNVSKRIALESAARALAELMRGVESPFPPFPENYVKRLRSALRAKDVPADAALISQLLEKDEEGRCGFQRLQLAEPKLIARSESWLRDGVFEPFFNSPEKYQEFYVRLRASREFRRDWLALRRAFPRETATKRIIHRSLVPERNWVRDGGAKFRTRRERFQACFDLLCWKYCLWGVGRGRPLLLKPSVVLTPLGTQIFIPSYYSLDAKRDLKFSEITKLHRARGLQRQGPGFSDARSARLRDRALARKANQRAIARGIKGDERYRFISQCLGRPDNGDYREIRRLLSR